MAETTTLSFEINAELKAQAEELFASLGMTITDAIIMFLRQSIMVGGLPFELKLPHCGAETEATARHKTVHPRR